jgi:hypothetical protein
MTFYTAKEQLKNQNIKLLRRIPTWFAYQNEGKLKHWLIKILLADVGCIAVLVEFTEPIKMMENF